MSPDEITRDILVALIQKSGFSSIDAVCEAYKNIIKTVNDPFTNSET